MGVRDMLYRARLLKVTLVVKADDDQKNSEGAVGLDKKLPVGEADNNLVLIGLDRLYQKVVLDNWDTGAGRNRGRQDFALYRTDAVVAL